MPYMTSTKMPFTDKDGHLTNVVCYNVVSHDVTITSSLRNDAIILRTNFHIFLVK